MEIEMEYLVNINEVHTSAYTDEVFGLHELR